MAGIELNPQAVSLGSLQAASQQAGMQAQKSGKAQKTSFAASLRRTQEDAALQAEGLPAEIAGMSEEEFSGCLETVKAGSIPAPSFNVLFPGELALLDSGTEDSKIASYLHGALSRVKRLGGRVVVFGSGRSRKCPEDMDYCDAFRRLIQVTRLIDRKSVV